MENEISDMSDRSDRGIVTLVTFLTFVTDADLLNRKECKPALQSFASFPVDNYDIAFLNEQNSPSYTLHADGVTVTSSASAWLLASPLCSFTALL